MCLDRQDLRRYPRRAPTARPSADGTCSRRWIPRRLLLVAGTGDLSRRDVLRDEVLLGARHAVIVGPAVHQRQRRAEVAMPRRGVGGLALQCGGVTGVASGWSAFEIAYDEVVQEYQLVGSHDQR